MNCKHLGLRRWNHAKSIRYFSREQCHNHKIKIVDMWSRWKHRQVGQSGETIVTRRYSWGIQRLVSTHSNCYFSWGGGVFFKLKVPSSGQLFIWGGGSSWVVKTQSAKFWPTFHWGGGILGYAKFWPTFHWGGGRELYSWVVKTQSTKFWPTFHWGEGKGWGGGYSRKGYSWQNEPKILES